VRADLLHLRGVIEYRCGVLTDACATLMCGAGEVAPRDPGKALEMALDGGLAAMDAGDYDRVVRAADGAPLLPVGDDAELRFAASLIHGVGALLDGRSDAVPVLQAVLAGADDVTEPRRLLWAAVGAGAAGDHDQEHVLLRRAAAVARVTGAVDTLAVVLEGIAVGGLLSGRWEVAAEAAEGLELALAAGLPNSATLHRATLAWFAAVRGDGECRRLAAEVQEAARPAGAALANAIAEWGLALDDLAHGRPEEASARLAAAIAAPTGVGHPFIALHAIPDLVEAAVRGGRRDLAEAALPRLERHAGPDAPAWLRALAARCRGLLAGGDAAEQELAEALVLLAAGGRPFERARVQLLLGEHLRRARQRVDAREHLRAALEGFDALGAAPWSERARVELRASGETARKRDPSAVLQLTPQELQVARLVAQGLSNREIATQLFLSPRTIDAHLRGVFAKLGLTSRRQLAQIPLGVEPLAGVLTR
jgi:DNA-binding NarL/FixJ family response regulator